MRERDGAYNRAVRGYSSGVSPIKLAIIVAILVIVLVGFFCYLIWGNIAGEITLEAGSALEGSQFLVMDWGMSPKITSDVSKIDMSDTGDYIVKVRYHGTDFYPTLHVVDTLAPVVTSQDAVVYSANLPDPEIFIQQVQDGTTVSVTYVQTPDMSKEGLQEVQLCVTDRGGNSVFTTAKMNIMLDTEGPAILGVNDMSIYKGGSISFDSGVLVQDNCDTEPVLTVDSSKVDTNIAGTYEVVYRAVDAAGNASAKTAKLTVAERTDAYVEEAVINEMADEILDSIITPQMDAEAQVNAVYVWIQNYCTYRDSSDMTDRMQAAYAMMTELEGDSYSYYALSSLFFDRLGLPNIAIKRAAFSVRTSTHFWNMVSVDGGETYYHFDTCPQAGFSVRICLATDEQAEACNEYTAGYYTFDKSNYPATPVE